MIRTVQAYLYKYYWEHRYYLPNFLFEILGHLLFFLGLFTLMFRGDPTRFLQGLLGFLLWMSSLTVMYDAAMLVWEDSLLGTLEHIFMAPRPFWWILFARTVASLIVHTVLYVVFLAGAFGAYALTGQPLAFPSVPWGWILLAAAGLFLSCWGMGLLLFGVALVVKRAGSITGFLYWVLFFTSGALFAVQEQPEAFQILAMFTPVGPAGMVMVEAVRGGHPARFLGLLVINAVLYVLAGMMGMHLGLFRARKTGKMARY